MQLIDGVTTAAAQDAPECLPIDILRPARAEKHDGGVFNTFAPQIHVAGHVQAVTGELHAIDRQRTPGADVARKCNALTVLEGSTVGADTDCQSRAIGRFHATDADGLQVGPVIAARLDAPGLQIPLDITGSDTEPLGKNSAPLQLVRSNKRQPLFEIARDNGGPASGGLN